MNKLHSILLLVLLFLFSVTNSYSQSIMNEIKVESTVSNPGIEICNTSTVTIRIKNISEEGLTNFKIAELMPPGMNYIPGSVSSNASEVNPILLPNNPVFTVNAPFVLNPDQVLHITFSIQAGCELIAQAEAGALLQNTTTVIYETADLIPVPGLKVKRSDSYNLLYPAPIVTKVTPKEIMGNIGSEQTRIIKVLNAGNGNLNAFWLKFTHPPGHQTTSVKVVGGANNYFTTSPSTSNGGVDMVYIPEAIASDDSLLIEQKFKINSCDAGGTAIRTFWGCDTSSFCDSSDVFMAYTVPTFGVPRMNVTETFYSPPDLCGNDGTVTYKYTNNGTETTVDGGIATEIKLFFSHNSPYVSLTNFEISADNSSWYSITASPSGSTETIDLSGGLDPDGAGEGLVDINTDGKYDLRIGKSFYVRFTINLDYPAGFFDACGPNFQHRYSLPSIHYNDQCFSHPQDVVYENLERYIKVKTCGIEGTGPIDMNGATDSTFTFCINEAEVSGTSCSNPSYSARITLPAGMSYVASSATFNGSPATATVSGSVITIPGTSASGCYSVELHLDCDATAGLYEEDKEVNWQIEYNCNPLLNSCPTLKLGCDKVKTRAKYLSTCSKSCTNNSIETSSFKAERATFGFADETLTPPMLTAASPGVRLDAVYPCDKINVTVKGMQKGDIIAPSMDIRYTLPGGINDQFLMIDPSTAVCIITYKYTAGGSTTTMACPFPLLTVTPGVPVFSGSETTFTDHFTWNCIPPDEIVIGSKPSPPIIVSYEISATYYVSNPNLIPPGTEHTIKDFRAQYYWLDPLPATSQAPNTCSSAGTRMTVINPGNKFETSIASTEGCDVTGIPVELIWTTYGSCGSGDDFPNEFRQVGRMTGPINAVIPVGFSYMPGSAVYTTSGPDGASMNATFTPPGTFTPTGLSWPLQDKYTDESVQSFSFRIVPNSCNANSGNTVPLAYTWIDKDYAGPLSSCYSLNSGQRNAIATYDKPDIRIVPVQQPDVYEAENETITLKVPIRNYGVAAENVWIAFETMSNDFQYLQVRDGATPIALASPSPYGAVNNIWVQVGSITGEKIIELDLKYRGCVPGQLTIKSSWSCEGYPINPMLANCPVSQNIITFHPRTPRVQVTLLPQYITTDFCQDTTEKYDSIEVRNISYGNFYDPKLQFTLPAGFDYLTGSMQFMYDAGWSNANPGSCIPPAANCYNLDVNTLNASIAANGLPGVSSFNIRYKLNAECGADYSDVGPVNLMEGSASGRSFCNVPIDRPFDKNPKIENIPEPDYSYSRPVFTADDIDKCAVPNTSLVHVKVVNNGGANTGSEDYIKIIIPKDVTYVPGSYTEISNSPNAPVFTPASPGSQKNTLSWDVSPGVLSGNAIEFTFEVTASPAMPLGTVPFVLNTGMEHKAYCETSGDTCIIGTVRTWDTIVVNIGCDTVNLPCALTATINGQDSACMNEWVVYHAQPVNGDYVYNWIAAGGSIINYSPDSSAIEVQWTTPGGMIILEIRDTVTGCIGFDTLLVKPRLECTCLFTKPLFTYLNNPANTGVQFVNASIADPLAIYREWNWDFGDGEYDMVENPFHIFPGPGTYHVCLTLSEIVVLNGDTIECKNLFCDSVVVDTLGTCNNDYFIDGLAVVCVNESHAYAAPIYYPSGTVYQWQILPGSPLNTIDAQSLDGEQILVTWGVLPAEIVLTVTDSAGCVDVDTFLVTSRTDCDFGCQSLQPGFTYLNNPANMGVQFQNTTIYTPGSINRAWRWDFGDGNSSSSEHPFHMYTAPGKYEVCIKVREEILNPDLNIYVRCVKIYCDTIEVDSIGTCQNDYFIDGPAISCPGNTDSYAAPIYYPAGTVYQWQIIPGSPANTIVSQSSDGDRIDVQWGALPAEIVLIVTDTAGCVDVDTLLVTRERDCPVCNLIPAFTYVNDPDNTGVQFYDATGFTGAGTSRTWEWDFGDGNSDIVQNPYHLYDFPGKYYVCLTVTEMIGDPTIGNLIKCSGTYCDTIIVDSIGCGDYEFRGYDSACVNDVLPYTVEHKPNVIYTWQATVGTITMSNPENNAIHVRWDALPAVLIVTMTDTVKNCVAFDTMFVSLRSDCDLECVITKAQFTYVNLPTGTGVQFTDGSTFDPNAVAKGWKWDFGDPASGTNNTSTDQHASHVFTAPGTYQVCLRIRSIIPGQSGDPDHDKVCEKIYCTYVVVDSIGDCNMPYNITGDNTVCAGDITDYQVPFYYPGTTYVWNVVGGTFTSNANGNEIQVTWITTPGYITVLVQDTAGCTAMDTLYLEDCVEVDVCVSVAAFRWVLTGTNDVQFFDMSVLAPTNSVNKSWFWTFGDGTYSSFQNPQHTYANPGTYIVCLSAYVDGCSSDRCDTIIIPPTAPCTIEADAGDDQVICGDSVTLGSNPTATGNGSGNFTYAWTPPTWLSDAASSNPKAYPPVQTTYMLVVTDVDANVGSLPCSDTDFVSVYPDLIVSAGPDKIICDNLKSMQSTVIGGTPTAQGGNNTFTYSWSPGTHLDDPAIANPIASPPSTTTYVVTVTSGTCTKKDTMVVFVEDCTQPCAVEAAFIAEPVINASGSNVFDMFTKTVNFQDISVPAQGTTITGWAWNFGEPGGSNPNTSNGQNPSHTYDNDGIYLVTLTVTAENVKGNSCTSTVTVPVEVGPTFDCEVTADFTSVKNQVVPFTYTFSSTSTTKAGTAIYRYKWSFSSNPADTSNLPVVAHTFAGPGPYNVCLEVFAQGTYGFCTSIHCVNNFNARKVNGDPESMNIIESYRMFPNPSEGITYIELSIANPGQVEIIVKDIAGRSIANVTDSRYESGKHLLNWIPDRELSEGLYIVEVKTADQVKQYRLFLLK